MNPGNASVKRSSCSLSFVLFGRLELPRSINDNRDSSSLVKKVMHLL